MVMRAPKTETIIRKCAYLFDQSISVCLRELRYKGKTIKVQGFIGTRGHNNNAIQLVYINNRLQLRTRIHTCIQNLLKNSLILSKIHTNTETTHEVNVSSKSHAIFIINIKCPRTIYDVTYEPTKSNVEFTEWKAMLSNLELAVQLFLQSENLTLNLNPATTIHATPSDEISTCSPSPLIEPPVEPPCAYGRTISTKICSNYIISEPVYNTDLVGPPIFKCNNATLFN